MSRYRVLIRYRINKHLNRETFYKFLVPVLSTLATLLLVEIVVRIDDSEYAFHNFLQHQRTLFRSAYPAAYHPQYGWFPEPDFDSTENVWGTRVSIDSDGLRVNGPDSAGLEGTIVAVGDSYTFGDEVNNEETWPAYLQVLTGKHVVNGGVFGYGIDQTVLRGRDLVHAYAPEAVVLSFVADDIRRTEMSERNSVAKPWFDIVENRMILHNSPVPKPEPEKTLSEMALVERLKNLAAYSYFVHDFMSEYFPHVWLQKKWAIVKAHENGLAVSCRLLQEFESFTAARGIALYLLVQYGDREPYDPEVTGELDRLLACAVLSPGTTVLDLRKTLLAIRATDPARYASLFRGHMTPRGNELVATRLAAAMTPTPTAGD